MQRVRLVLVGVGNLGRRFCEVLVRQTSLLESRYGLHLHLVGAADSRGAAYEPARGLDPGRVASIKRRGGSVGEYPGAGRRGWSAELLVATASADVLLEASPVNLRLGAEPGLSCIRTALRRRMHVVTPNKGPLVLAFDELHALAETHGVELRYDGAVAGGLPALNLGQRDLRGAMIYRMEAVPNLSTGLVMDLVSCGATWEQAVARAREEGTLEGDGSWDLEGWDAAAKLVILVNAVLGQPARLEHVAVGGIRGLDAELLIGAREQGSRYRLLATARRRPDGTYGLSVRPVPLAPDHPLGRLGPRAMGITFQTDIYGTITAIIDEEDPVPSAATMLRDVLDIYSGDARR